MFGKNRTIDDFRKRNFSNSKESIEPRVMEKFVRSLNYWAVDKFLMCGGQRIPLNEGDVIVINHDKRGKRTWEHHDEDIVRAIIECNKTKYIFFIKSNMDGYDYSYISDHFLINSYERLQECLVAYFGYVGSGHFEGRFHFPLDQPHVSSSRRLVEDYEAQIEEYHRKYYQLRAEFSDLSLKESAAQSDNRLLRTQAERMKKTIERLEARNAELWDQVFGDEGKD